MTKGTVSSQMPPSPVPRSPMSPISPTPGPQGSPQRIPLPPGPVPPFTGTAG